MASFKGQNTAEGDDGCIRLEAHPIPARSPVRGALRVMDVKRTDVLPVIDEETGQVLGIVLRQALERGCLKMGHKPDECTVAEHTMREVLGTVPAERQGKTRRSVAQQYRLVLDDAGFPLAILWYK
jgi:hypothetical protein